MEIKKILKNNKGFSLIELIISSVATLIIMGSIFTVLISFSQKSNDDQSRVRQIQESRFVMNILSSDLKNAGSMLTLGKAYLAGSPYFTGIYPLNKNDNPDGIIIASGDPEALTTLYTPFAPSGNNNIPVMTTDVCTDCTKWQEGDYGIIMGIDGYYVFIVTKTPDPGDSVLEKRTQPVYYSGLLDSDGYEDRREGSTVDGNTITYPMTAPVIRLTNFSIYLIKSQYDSDLRRTRRDLVRVVDAVGDDDVLNSATSIRYVMAENIWDMQIGYSVYPDLPAVTNRKDFFINGSTEHISFLIPELQELALSEIYVSIVALTDNFVGTEIENMIIPALGDRPANSLPSGKYYYKIYNMLIQPKNQSIGI